jgi:hypothetical protein
VDQRVADSVPENGTKSHDAAFETWLSEQPWTSVRIYGKGGHSQRGIDSSPE